MCHAVRAPGSKVTLAPATRAGSGESNRGSIRTVPVNQSAGPLPEGREPFRLISIRHLLSNPHRKPTRFISGMAIGNVAAVCSHPRKESTDAIARRALSIRDSTELAEVQPYAELIPSTHSAR